MKIEQNSFGNLNFRHDWLDSLPRPLAYTYARLIEEIESKEPIAAAWALRDAWDCAIRLTACLALADLIAAKPPEKKLHEVMEVLFKVSGVSLGDWARLVAIGCDGKIKTEHPRLLPKLTHFYRTERGLLTPIGNLLSGGKSPSLIDEPELDDVALLGPGKVNIVTWRNKVMAHGVFRRNRSWYVAQIVQWMPALHQYYEALMPALEGWTLCEGDTAGTLLMGMGASDPVGTHQHVSTEAAHTVVLTGAAGTLSFGPLLSAQRCAICGERHIFFYDRSQRNKSGPDALRTELLDYLAGHIDHRRGWPPALDWENYLAGQLKQDHVWQRQAVSQQELAEQTRSVFNRFADSYMRPDWIMDQLWNEIDTLERGYVHLEAPAGTGKSYLARALKEQESPARGLPALLYHIQPGLRADYRTFIMLLGDEAKEQLNARTQEIQAKDQGIAGLRQQFIEFFDYLMCANRLDSLLLVIDGLDELPARVEPSEFAITDFLPPAGELPKGCVVVLTGRSNLREGIADRIEQIATESGNNYRKVVLNPGNPSNRELLIAYTLTSLPEKLREQTLAERIVERARGIFLYTFHLVQALNAGAFSPGEELPAAEAFYQAYLGKLRERVGDGLYEEIYRTLLLFLAAAGEPVTLDQLRSWGLRADRLDSALLDIADFLDEVRWRPWHDRVDDTDERPRYRIAHAEFIDFLKGAPDLAKHLSKAKDRITNVLLRRHEDAWDNLDATSEEDVFDIQFILAVAKGPCTNPDLDFLALTLGSIELANGLTTRQRWNKAEIILAQSVANLRNLMRGEMNLELIHCLARALNLYGHVLLSLKGPGEAEACHADNVTICDWLTEFESHSESAIRFALALTNHGQVLHKLRRLEDAENASRQAVAILRGLVEDEGRSELTNNLATALNNYGLVQQSLKCLEEAEFHLAEAVILWRHLVKQEGHLELLFDLAIALNNHGGILGEQGRLEEAEDAKAHAVAFLRGLVEDEGRKELSNELATVLTSHGLVLLALNRLEEANHNLLEAVELYRLLVEHEGRQELILDFAHSLKGLGEVLMKLDCLEEAEDCSAQAVAILRQQVKHEGRWEQLFALAAALSQFGLVLQALDRLDSAEAHHAEAVTILRTLVHEGHEGLLSDLAIALDNHAFVLQARNRQHDAERQLRDRVELLRNLVRQSESDLFREDLTDALGEYGNLLSALGKPKSSKKIFRECVDISEMNRALAHPPYMDSLLTKLSYVANACSETSDWHGVLDTVGRMEVLICNMAGNALWALKILSYRGIALLGMGNVDAALKYFERGISLTTGDSEALIWNCAFIYHRAKALATQEDPKAGDACDEALKIWQNGFDHEPNETNTYFFARSLILNSRRNLKNGMPKTAFENANQATNLLATLVPKHWRYREPLAEALSLSADASEELMQFETAATLRDKAQRLLVPPIEE